MSDDRTHILKHPVEVTFVSSKGDRTETITEVTMKPLLKTKQLRALDRAEGDVGKAISMIAHLSGLTIAQVDELHPDDFEVLSAMAQGFTPPGQPIGGNSSES